MWQSSAPGALTDSGVWVGESLGGWASADLSCVADFGRLEGGHRLSSSLRNGSSANTGGFVQQSDSQVFRVAVNTRIEVEHWATVQSNYTPVACRTVFAMTGPSSGILLDPGVPASVLNAIYDNASFVRFTGLLRPGDYTYNIRFITYCSSQHTVYPPPDARHSNSSFLFRMRFNPCPGDYDWDGIVDFNDYLAFLNDYNGAHPRSDINLDGVVDFNDYLAFLNNYNAPC